MPHMIYLEQRRRPIFYRRRRARWSQYAMIGTMLLVMGLLAACAPPAGTTGPVGGLAASRTEVIPVTADRLVRFEPGASRLGDEAAREVIGFLNQYKSQPSARIIVIAANPYTKPGDARIAALGDLVAETLGRRPGWLRPPGDDFPLQPNTLGLRVQAMMTRHQGCPGWDVPARETAMNAPSGHFGCASEANLAAMIADPADLTGDRPPPSLEARPAADAVYRYRRGERRLPEETYSR